MDCIIKILKYVKEEIEQMKQSDKNLALSIKKIKASILSNSLCLQFRNENNKPLPLSQELQFDTNLSPTLRGNGKKQQYQSRLSKFYKKEIRTHQKSVNKNTRIRLIQNTQKLISPNVVSFQKQIQHSSRRLRRQRNGQVRSQSKNQSFNNSNYFISLPQPVSQNNKIYIFSQKIDRQRRNSQENNRIFKGITSRKESSRIGRNSMQLDWYRQNHNQNQQDFVQHKKINLYHSLINPGNFRNSTTSNPVTEFKSVSYTRIQRIHVPDQYCCKKNEKGSYNQQKQRQFRLTGFPTKKLDRNQLQVSTLHMKHAQNKLRSSLGHRTEKDSKQYYHPRLTPSSNLSIFKRPNTTMANPQRDSEIQPW